MVNPEKVVGRVMNCRLYDKKTGRCKEVTDHRTGEKTICTPEFHKKWGVCMFKEPIPISDKPERSGTKRESSRGEAGSSVKTQKKPAKNSTKSKSKKGGRNGSGQKARGKRLARKTRKLSTSKKR
jgi:hypothetical protein